MVIVKFDMISFGFLAGPAPPSAPSPSAAASSPPPALGGTYTDTESVILLELVFSIPSDAVK